MLTIKNIEKIIGANLRRVQVKSVQMTDKQHPQRTYDIVFEHIYRPKREFFLTIDREGGYIGVSSIIEYPISFWELTGPHNKSTDATIWEKNLQTPDLLLGFMDTLINNYTT